MGQTMDGQVKGEAEEGAGRAVYMAQTDQDDLTFVGMETIWNGKSPESRLCDTKSQEKRGAMCGRDMTSLEVTLAVITSVSSVVSLSVIAILLIQAQGDTTMSTTSVISNSQPQVSSKVVENAITLAESVPKDVKNVTKDVHNLTESDHNLNIKNGDRDDLGKDVDICVKPECVMAAARMLNSLDTKIDPCDNFFEYACGTWNRMNVIPDDKASYDTFSQLRGHLEVVMKGLLEEPIADTDITAVRKTKHFYQSCVGTAAIKNLGLQPVHNLLRKLGGWPVINGSDWNDTDFDLVDLLVQLRMYNNKILIEQWVSADDKQSDTHIIQLDQADLGMPSPEYFKADAAVEMYLDFAINVAIAFGADPEVADQDMRKMVDFEVLLANITVPQEKRRDAVTIYNKMTVEELQRNVSGFDWLRYLQQIFSSSNITITEDEEIVVFAVEYLSDLTKLIEQTDNRVLVNYLIWRIMMNRVNNLGQSYRNLRNDYIKMIDGREVHSARWRDCVNFVNDNMGNVIGRLFVQRNFDEDAKHKADSMVHYIRESFYDALDEALWMNDKTRIVAKEKAEAITQKIGYPEIILNDTAMDEDYKAIDFSPDHYFDNVLSNIKNLALHNIRKLRKPVDKSEWSTTPAVVNAFYSTSKNQIYFPAAILQPPFYSKGYLTSMNFGGIGMVIGHEITHGFDDRGRLYDKDGNMKRWWDDDVITRFKEEAQCVIDQYSNFTIESINMTLNGVHTQGENIADNGGLKEAFMGYRKWIEKENGGKEEPRLPGLEHLDNNQLFFLNFAQIWCGTLRPKAAIRKVITGAHSPGKFRVTGTLQNSQEFAETFKCPLNSHMNPQKKCNVW